MPSPSLRRSLQRAPVLPRDFETGHRKPQPSQVWCRQDDRPVSGSGRVKGPAGAGTRSHCMTNTEGRRMGEFTRGVLPSLCPQITSCFSPSSHSPFPAPAILASGPSTPLLSRELAYLSPSSPQPAPPFAGFTSLSPTTFQPTWNKICFLDLTHSRLEHSAVPLSSFPTDVIPKKKSVKTTNTVKKMGRLIRSE